MKLLKEYIELMLEVPIRDLEMVGTPWDKKGGGFDKRDRKLLSNPKAIEKIRKKWEKTPFMFDIYLLKIPALNKPEWKEIGKIEPGSGTWDVVEEEMSKYGMEKIPNSPDAITILFNGNYGSEKIPMTAWTMAHRFGHAVRGDKAWYEYLKEVQFFLKDTLKQLYDIESSIRKTVGFSSGFPSQETEELWHRVAEQIGTMKSAREKNLRNLYEFYYELLAQYLITGQVKFNKFPEKLIVKNLPYGRKETRTAKYGQEMLDYINESLDSYEHMIESRLKNVFYGAEGNVYLM